MPKITNGHTVREASDLEWKLIQDSPKTYPDWRIVADEPPAEVKREIAQRQDGARQVPPQRKPQ